MTAAVPADGERVELATWLAPGVLALVAQIEAIGDASEWLLRVEWGEDMLERPIRWLPCTDTSGASARQEGLLTVTLPRRLVGAQLRAVVLRAGGRERALAPAPLDSVLCQPRELGAECRARFGSAPGRRIQNFLAATPVEHRIDLSLALAQNLAALRSEVREQLPTTKLEPGPCTMRLEDVTALDEYGFWLTGWVHDADPREVRFTAVSPEGSRRELPIGTVSFHPRPAYALTLKDDAQVSTLGYHAYVELDHPSRHPRGWVMEFRTSAGRAVEATAIRPVHKDTGPLRELLVTQVRTSPQDEPMFEHQVLPARTRLRGDASDTKIDRVVSLGDVPEAPELSIVVAVRRADRIDHQLLSFAHDPDLDDAELIYVASPPDPEDDLLGLAEGLHDLHGLPFQLAIASGPLRRARALNLGASLARGKLLVLMGGEVFPSAPGWIANMRELLEGSANVGAVGPKLLYEDNSIAHAGIAYVRRSTGRWRRSLPFAGLAPTLAGANVHRRVQAVSEACLMVDHELFDRSGCFSELYLDGGDEGGDLCLRLADDAEIWYAPDAELHLLDEDPPSQPSRGDALFNDWLFDRRCGLRLAAVAVDESAAEMPARMPRLPTIPVLGSGRSGAPVEILELTTPEIESSVVLDASIELPSADGEGAYADTYTLAIAGWAITSQGGPLAIELSAGGDAQWRTQADMHRPDIGARFPDRPAAHESGFQFLISALSLPAEFQLEVTAVSDTGARALLGRISGRRRTLASGYRPRLQPLLMSTLGRSGSAWLAALLSLHPEVIALNPFRFEAKLTSYWIDVLHALAEPGSYMQMILPEISDPSWWIGSRQTPLPVHLRGSPMSQWLACENVEVLAGFCQSRLDGFYQELANREKRSGARCFVEKCYPGRVPRAIGELYPESREIVLVRDLRDMVCSIDDYNAKRGFMLWGRDKADTDKEWFGHLRREASKLLDGLHERPERAHLVRYEDLIAEPERTLTVLLSHAGLNANAGVARRMLDEDASQALEAKRFHQTSGSAEQSVGRWKDALSPERRELCADAFDDLLVEFGYEPTNEVTERELLPDADQALDA